MGLRDYSGTAKATQLAGDISAATTTINLVDGTGYPTGAAGPFIITLDAGLTNEEKVLCASRVTNTITVAPSGRGFDGTTASDHKNTAVVQHTFSALDAREANDHVNNVAADPHPQYLTQAEGAGLFAGGTHTHNYADPAHVHTYASITNKPSFGLLASSGKIAYSHPGGVYAVATGSSVTFAFPSSGRVLIRQSGLVSGSTQADINLGIGTASAPSQTADAAIRTAGGHAVTVNNVYFDTGSPGQTFTYKSFVSSTAGVTWYGYVEVWAAP